MYSSKKISDILNEIQKVSHTFPASEICGFIGKSNGKYHFQISKNISKEPAKLFALDPLAFLLFKNEHEIVAIFHSHILGDEKPSEFDIKMSEVCCLPFMIYGLNTKKFHIYSPKNKDFDVNTLQRFKDKI